MTKEKQTLMKTLKDENLRAETRKFTSNLMKNKTSNSFSMSNNINTDTGKNQNNTSDINNNDKFIPTEVRIEHENPQKEAEVISNTKKKKIIKKKKKKVKKEEEKENVIKAGEEIKKGPKYKLLTYQKLSDINKQNEISNKKGENEEKEKETNGNEKEDKIKNEDQGLSNTNIKDKENTNNKTRRDLLNSLNSLQYNFDNLMSIGVHGTKILNQKKK